MRCTEVQGALADYQAGNLPDRVVEQMREHLEACAECRGDLAGLERVALVLSSAAPVEPSHDLTPVLFARLAERERRWWAWLERLFSPPAVKIAAATAVFLIVFLSIPFATSRPAKVDVALAPPAAIGGQLDPSASTYVVGHEALAQGGFAADQAASTVVSVYARISEGTAHHPNHGTGEADR